MGASFESCIWIEFAVVYLESTARWEYISQIVDTYYFGGVMAEILDDATYQKLNVETKEEKLNVNIPRVNELSDWSPMSNSQNVHNKYL